MVELESLTPVELRELSAKAEKIATEKEKNKVTTAVALINETAKSIGAKVEVTLPGGVPAKKARGSMPATHRNPENGKEVWRGMGPKPGWLKVQLEAGRELAEFQV
jgi:DNA-binding protein H-NS